MLVLTIIGLVVYLGIGVAVMSLIRRDSEFREMESIGLFAYGSIVLWPVLGPLYYFLRPAEKLDDLGAKKTYQDFKNFMKQRKRGEGDLFTKLDRATTPGSPVEIGDARDQFRDYHLDELIDMGNWMEALRTANDMLRFAREQQEPLRIASYETYIKEIKDRRNKEMHEEMEGR